VSMSRGPASRGRRMAVAVALVASCGAVVLGSAGTASAGNTITCGGKVVPANKKKPGEDATFSIQCSENFRAFALVTTQKLSFFGTENTVTPTTTESATLQCEGTVPGYGFGCGIVNRSSAAAKVTAGSILSSDVSFEESPCDAKHPLKVWVTATSEPDVVSSDPKGGPDTKTVGEYASQPFQLSTKGWSAKKCKASAKGGKKSKK
jgi:hypothetical protein